MKKLIIALISVLIVNVSIFAGPFGLDMGMTLEEVSGVCERKPTHISDDRYYIKPQKAHPLFEGYVVWINEEYGLYYIKGRSKEIGSNDYGTEVKQEFAKLLSPLERKYGKFNHTDKLAKDTLFRDDKYWMMAIAEGSRTYEAHWEAAENNVQGFEGLVSIATGVKTTSTNIAYIWIEYGFMNAMQGFDNLDDVL